MKLHGDRPAFPANLAVRCATFAAGAFCLAGLATVAVLPGVAQAQSAKHHRDLTPEADQAIAGNNWPAALAALDKRVAANPRDVQARFKRATVLARMGRDDEAIQAFTDITQTTPELPEPYNNLAALYAKRGQYQQARAVLETALAANPAFALARRNLGDIYLRLAADSYQQTLRQDPSDGVAAGRAKALQSLLAAHPASAATRRPAHAPAPVADDAPATTSAEAVNARGFVPSMGAQPPTILSVPTNDAVGATVE
ncbi:tetratricopeptide repeat protein [Robbsia sp. Bb-Pol-6]|uniref:Tetratricopeptide repeat protein n=1 Tax=Robbsia betulipollinis TaxID=2981849 RepID=A0ABT3ZN37_9BURK|nr:tetratricopeptide repeat protein [Robbsia betulipollinis]MCY0387958.1 tetratricopeptide repeat protein [Robbsia betulipollinis]